MVSCAFQKVFYSVYATWLLHTTSSLALPASVISGTGSQIAALLQFPDVLDIRTSIKQPSDLMRKLPALDGYQFMPGTTYAMIGLPKANSQGKFCLPSLTMISMTTASQVGGVDQVKKTTVKMSPVSAGVGFNGPPQPEPELSTESATAMTTNLGWYFFGRIGSGSTGPQQTGPIASKVMASCQDAVTTMANGLGAEIKPSFYVPTKQELTTINNAQKNTNGVSFTTPIQNEVSDNKRKATEDPTAAQPPPAKQVKETPAPVTTNSAAAAKPAPGMPQLASPATTTGSPPPVVSPPKGSTPGSSGTPQLPSPATSAASTDYFGNWEQYVKTPSSPSTPSWASPSPAPAAIKPAAAAGSAAKSTGPVPGAKDYFQDWSNPSINPHRPVRPQ